MATTRKSDGPSTLLKRAVTSSIHIGHARRPSDLSPIPEIPDNRMSLSLKRRYPFNQLPGAPLAAPDANHNNAVPPPAFMSIFNPDSDMTGCSTALQTQSSLYEKPVLSAVTSPFPLQRPPLHNQHSSVSTSASSSNNTSPTTTVSTLESAMAEDNTPGTSPESPPALLTSFKAVSSDSSPNCDRPHSPSKRPRNAKNLSLNVPAVGEAALPARSSGNGTPKSISAPNSPGFIKPPVPTPPNSRRRPSHLGLTIKLPATLPDKLAPRTGILRHHQSSPSLLSPSVRGPNGGMTLPPPSAGFKQTTFQRPSFNMRWNSESTSDLPSSSSDSPPKSPNDVLLEMDEDEEDIHGPRSGEPKSPAYPNGPHCIFDPNVYLFAEPDAKLAAQFDVVINVAREVLNPFDVAEDEAAAVEEAEAPIKTSFNMDSIFSPVDGKPIEFPPPAPVRPRLYPLEKRPEYIHMPWEHNTAILDDLPRLVEVIDRRSSEGKKVLVHCQCGVSRSATLLIAYSMYKNPEKTMQDAYSAVKSRSRWIGPNMSLIYQLTDWKKRLTADMSGPKTAKWGPMSNMNGPRTAGMTKPSSATGFGRGLGFNTDGEDEMVEPQTAPLPPLGGFSSMMSGPPSGKPQVVRARSDTGGYVTSFTPGPSSAPPTMLLANGKLLARDNRQSWPDGDARFPRPAPISGSARTPDAPPAEHRLSWPESPFDAAGQPLPSPPARAPPPPPILPKPDNTTSYTVNRVSFALPSDHVDRPFNCSAPPAATEDDTITSPIDPVTSPRSSGIWATMPSRRSGGWSLFADPRSPTERAQSGGSQVLRNIFDVL